MLKLYVLGNAQRAGVAAEVERWLPYLRERAEVLIVDLRQEADLCRDCPPADLALVFGGDGAILRAARQMAYQQIPVLGINLGRLGFLADIQAQEFTDVFEQVLLNNFRIARHLMYECIVRDTQTASTLTFLGLNEVVVHNTPPFHLLELELEVDGALVSRFGGDGLIISTPVGSTAHNLSAGGPILGQELAAFVITPISPHSLSFRPLVESAERTFSIRLARPEGRAMVVSDGQATAELSSQHHIQIRRAPVSFSLVKVPQRSYYQTLRDKLRWGTTPHYRDRGEP